MNLSLKIQTNRSTNWKPKVKNVSVFVSDTFTDHKSNYPAIIVDMDDWTEDKKQNEPMYTILFDGKRTKRMTGKEIAKIFKNYLK